MRTTPPRSDTASPSRTRFAVPRRRVHVREPLAVQRVERPASRTSCDVDQDVDASREGALEAGGRDHPALPRGHVTRVAVEPDELHARRVQGIDEGATSAGEGTGAAKGHQNSTARKPAAAAA
jgi:hypothetical protein